MEGSSGRRERKRQQMADRLADTAWEMFETQGYEAVTMEAIAGAADVTKRTLYKHFPVKEALLRHRFHLDLAEGMPAMLAELAALPTAADRLCGFLERSAVWAQANRPHLIPYLRLRLGELGIPYEIDATTRSGIEPLFTGLIRDGQESGEFRSDLDARTAAHYLEFLYLASLLRWLNGAQPDLQAEFRSMLDLYLRGFAR